MNMLRIFVYYHFPVLINQTCCDCNATYLMKVNATYSNKKIAAQY